MIKLYIPPAGAAQNDQLNPVAQAHQTWIQSYSFIMQMKFENRSIKRKEYVRTGSFDTLTMAMMIIIVVADIIMLDTAPMSFFLVILGARQYYNSDKLW